MYSTITKKKCKCGCDKWPTLGYGGYFAAHAPQELKDKVGTKRDVTRKNHNNKLALGRKLHEAQNVVSSAEMNRWHDERRKEATGICSNCGGKTCKDSNMYFRYSNAHILPKAWLVGMRSLQNS